MQIKSWSYSRLTGLEQCALRAKLAYIDRIPEPERPLPPGKTEHANDRGTRIHLAAELFVRGEAELIPSCTLSASSSSGSASCTRKAACPSKASGASIRTGCRPH